MPNRRFPRMIPARPSQARPSIGGGSLPGEPVCHAKQLGDRALHDKPSRSPPAVRSPTFPPSCRCAPPTRTRPRNATSHWCFFGPLLCANAAAESGSIRVNRGLRKEPPRQSPQERRHLLSRPDGEGLTSREAMFASQMFLRWSRPFATKTIYIPPRYHTAHVCICALCTPLRQKSMTRPHA